MNSRVFKVGPVVEGEPEPGDCWPLVRWPAVGAVDDEGEPAEVIMLVVAAVDEGDALAVMVADG